MTVNRLIIFSIFIAVLLLATPLFNIGEVSAAFNPAPSKAHAWFYPAADPVPLTPLDTPSLINLWIAETKTSGPDFIDQIQIVQPGGFPYVLGGAEVYGFNSTTNNWSLVSGTGSPDWQVTTVYSGFGPDIMGYTIDWIGPPGTGLEYNGSGYSILVVKIIVIGYKNPADAITGVTNEWRVSVRWDSGDSLDMLVDHTVDNTPPSISLAPGTASLLSQPCLATSAFWFNVSVSDNLPLTGLNETEYGAYAQNGTHIAPTKLSYGFTKSQALNFDVGLEWYISASLKNDYLPSVLGSAVPDFEPNTGLNDASNFNGFINATAGPFSPLNESTEGELGYLWAFILVFVEVDFYLPSGAGVWDANYSYFNRLTHFGGNMFGDYVNLSNAMLVQGAGPPFLGLAINSLNVAQMRVTVVVAAFDGTLDYHKDWNMSNGSVNGYGDYNDTVSADIPPSLNYYNMITQVYSFLVDISAAPVSVTLNGNFVPGLPHDASLGEPNPFPLSVNHRTPYFTLSWNWWPAYGPDPTAQFFIVQIDRWNGTNWVNVINDTVPALPLSGPFFYTFDVIQYGTGNYSIHILLKDCGPAKPVGQDSVLPAPFEWRWEFNVTYFLVVYINNNPQSLWVNGPMAWEVFEQNDVIPISVYTFGTKKDGSPLNWAQYQVNITLNIQGPGPSVVNVTSFTATTPSAVTATYAWWNFTVDSNADLGNVIGIYNVTASWMNISSNTQVDNNFNIPGPPTIEQSTFILKPKIFLHFFVYDDMYSTGETATFFGHVASVTWPAPGSNVPGALVAFDVVRAANGVPMATGFGWSNAQGFVVPSLFGEITFGTEIGDDWPAGVYNVNATAYYNVSVGFWMGTPIFVISTDSVTDQFTVWVYRDENISAGFSDVMAAISSLANDVANVANDLSNVIDILNNDVLPALSDIMNQLSALSGTVSDLQAAISDLESAVADLQATVAALSDVQAALSDLQDSVDALAGQMADVLNALSDLQGAVADVQDALDSLANTVSDLQSSLDALAGDVADVKSAVDNVASAVDDVASAVDDVASAVDSLAGDVSDGFSSLSDKVDSVQSSLSDKIDSAAGDLSGMVTASLVLLIVAIAVSAVTAFKVFRG